MRALEAIDQDAITELMNLGVGRAAAAFSRMVGEEVVLSVPEVRLLTYREMLNILGELESARLMGVRQTYKGPFSGTAALIFPESKSLELVRTVLGDELSLDEITELEQEALSEIGNIILNGCLATIANVLHEEIVTSLPSLLDSHGHNILGIAPETTDPDTAVLFLNIDFLVRSKDIRGYITFVMDVVSLDHFNDRLKAYVASLA